jgi:hypothetical protein
MWEGLEAKQAKERWWPLQEPSWVPATSALESQEDGREALSMLYEPTFLFWGPTSLVTYLKL